METFCKTGLLISLLLVWLSAQGNAIDPMAPPGYDSRLNTTDDAKKIHKTHKRKKRGSKGYVVQQVLIRGTSKTATINNRLVQEGDTVGKAKVLSIAKKRVVIAIGGKRKVLPVQERYPDIKVRAGSSAAN